MFCDVEAKFNAFDIGNMHPIVTMSFLYKMGSDLVNSYMEYPEIKEFLKTKEKFDVCIIEIFNADAMLVRLKKCCEILKLVINIALSGHSRTI